MRENSREYYVQRRGIMKLCGAFLAAPAAWILHQQSSYLLVYRICDGGQAFLFHIAALVCLLIAAAGTYLAWSAWNDSGRGWTDEGGDVLDRSRFLALGGLLLSGMFCLVILAQWIPTLLVDPCVR